MQDKNLHYSVMLKESIESLDLHIGETVVDCTVNRAGHAIEIAKAIGPSGTLIMFDLDEQALKEAEQRLRAATPSLADASATPSKEGEFQAPTLHFIHSNYRNIKSELEKVGINKVDKIFADLGLSSQELEISGRGFTFQKDEPLYMTFNSHVDKDTFTAIDLLQNLDARQLERIFQVYGDEKNAWKISNAIVAERERLNDKKKKIETTTQLVQIIESVSPKNGKTNPSTKVFQAIRIAVNDEYEGIKDLINDGYEILNEGGIISIITFHSGEDRIVKKFFKELCNRETENEEVKQKPSRDEILKNKRSRSALLRTLTKKFTKV